ncbi:hypothetical protein HPB50_011863 [Hyalomma asiaticum]|uniref:Uncharacterized protein n=1 Tax=Hyalomma asiaticum TaxID=266040 RepID=A0ACB7TGU4_HYAAI|nr:hypothetical protein HPB50_011863 [Hyalomma asiaticum]
MMSVPQDASLTSWEFLLNGEQFCQPRHKKVQDGLKFRTKLYSATPSRTRKAKRARSGRAAWDRPMPPPGASRPRRREEAEEEVPEAGVPNAADQSVGPRAGASEAAAAAVVREKQIPMAGLRAPAD